MHPYADKIGSISGANQQMVRLSHILGTDAVSRPSSVSEFLHDIKATAPPDVDDGVGTLAGAAAGAILWKNHRVLGLIGGASLGRNVPAFVMNPHERRIALINMGITSAAILGSLAVPRHKIIGFCLGWLAGGAVTYATHMRNP